MSDSESQKQSAAARLGLTTDGNDVNITGKSVISAVGGTFGIIESVLPSLAFVSLLSITKNTTIAVITAVSISAAFLLVSILKRKPLTQAFAGALGIAISAFLPLREGGHAADYFIQGFLTNSIYLLALLASIAIRFPLIGVLVGLLIGKGTAWRKNKGQYRRFQVATLLWVGLFGARLLVQVPLYFANQLEALGLFRIVMGVPLYALCLWLTWLLVRSVIQGRR